MTSLNPVLTVGAQIAEVIRRHETLSRAAARAPRRGVARPGRHPRAAAARRRIPAQLFRRHAAAGDDRHGGRVPAAADHRRRADDRAGCDDPGAGAGSAGRAAPATRHGGAADHPRSRRRRAMGRPGDRDVCRPHRRAGGGAAVLPPPAAPLRPRPARRLGERGDSRRQRGRPLHHAAAERDSRLGRLGRRRAGLPVRAALSRHDPACRAAPPALEPMARRLGRWPASAPPETEVPHVAAVG